MKINRNRKTVGLAFVCLFIMSVIVAYSAQAKFVGSKKCKVCHTEVFEKWETLKHSEAWDDLKPEDRKNPECIKCHTTNGVERPAVQCEACHGPASEYVKPAVMNKARWKADHEKNLKVAIAKGLVNKPDEKVCVRCHNKKSPNYIEFNFEEFKEKIKHWDLDK